MNEKNQPEKRKLSKPVIVTIILIILIFGPILAWNLVGTFMMKHYFANFQPPPISVSTTKVEAKSWQNYLPTIGILQPIQTVDVTPEISGIVTDIFFKSGEKVETGKPLVQLNDEVEQQDLKNLEADLIYAKLTADRLKTLIKTKATSQAEVDQAQAKLDQAQAQVEKTKVLIAQKNIKAPFTGKLGIREVNLGEYISPGKKLVSLESMNPLFLNFSLPEQHLKQLYLGQPVKLTTDAQPGLTFSGKITAVDSKANQSTHNILIQATIPNDNRKLYPGLFANVKVMLPVQNEVMIVPQTAVTYSLYGDAVFVVEEKKEKGKTSLTVSQKYVKVGPHFENKVVITEGIKPGDQIVTSGQLKLQNGSRVTINNDVKL